MADCLYHIYTDGGSIGNPGPGGYGVVLLWGKTRQEFSGGYRLTTNNRMELMAAIVGLGATPENSRVRLYADSRYLVDGMNKGLAEGWRANRWKKANKRTALNIDLWKIVLSLCEVRQVEFIWVAGHAGNKENERCDWLSRQAAARKNLPPDTGYETEQTRQASLFG